MTWPPAVAVNSNRPELLTGAAPGGKKKKPGIIYLSAIPPGFNVSRTTGFFAQYGKIGRVYLQPGMKGFWIRVLGLCRGKKTPMQSRRVTCLHFSLIIYRATR